MPTTLAFTEINLNSLPQVGGKNASLGEMITKLSTLGINVPKGFATSTDAYQEFLHANKLDTKIYTVLATLDVDDIAQLKK